jgi:hypothetical protein
MTTIVKPDQLLLRLRPTDTPNGVSRATLERLAEYLGFSGEIGQIQPFLNHGPALVARSVIRWAIFAFLRYNSDFPLSPRGPLLQ